MGSLVLSKEERLAVMNVVKAMSPDDLETALFTELAASISDFGSDRDAMPVTALNFLKWALQRPEDLGQMLSALRDQYPGHPDMPTIEMIREKIASLAARAPADPFKACLIGPAVVVDRDQMRDMLRKLVDGFARPVIRVIGPPRSGRSQSWQLIRHIAHEHSIPAERLDLDAWVVEQRTLPELVQTLIDACALRGFTKPTEEGVTPETLGQRYATRVGECLERLGPGDSLWLVFDSLDRTLAPEITAFIRRLAELALQPAFSRCTIFLLGPGGQADAPQSVAVLSETLGPFLEREIEEAATAVNGLGTTPLGTAELMEKIRDLKTAHRNAESSSRGLVVSEGLTALRYAAGAP
jgi:hypothetical protein